MCRLFQNLLYRVFGMQRESRNVSTLSNKEKFCQMTIKEKRKLYKCQDDYVQLKDILTWPEYASYHSKTLTKGHQGKKSRVGSESSYEVNEALNEKVSIWTGDITCLEIDAIVNAANKGLRGGGGVDGAIHSAAGRSLLQEECQEIGFCDTGDAVMTLGYKLPAKYVVHTVGPMGRNDEKLRSCYRTCLQLMEERKLKSIAFPCISTGIYGFPNEAAAPIAIDTVRQFLETDYGSQVDRIIFCLFMEVDVKLYQAYMQHFFPVMNATRQSPELSKVATPTSPEAPPTLGADSQNNNANGEPSDVATEGAVSMSVEASPTDEPTPTSFPGPSNKGSEEAWPMSLEVHPTDLDEPSDVTCDETTPMSLETIPTQNSDSQNTTADDEDLILPEVPESDPDESDPNDDAMPAEKVKKPNDCPPPK